MVRRNRWLAVSILIIGPAIGGCDDASPAPAEPPAAPVETAKHSIKVAELAFSGGRKLEILETGIGGFGYVQSGPTGVTPVTLPEELLKEGDPVAVFRALAPDKAVPTSLTDAMNRAVSFLADPANDLSKLRPVGGGELPSSDAKIAVLRQALGTRDTNQAGSTGQVGCPEWWFNQATVNGRLFCPNSGGDPVCYKWVGWAYKYKSNAHGSYGDVCVDSGQAIFQATFGNTVDTFWVDAGTWRFVQYYAAHSCGWFGCSPVRAFQKFEMLNSGAVGHFGAQMN